MSKYKIQLIIILLFCILQTHAQGPYQLDFNREAGIYAGGLLSLGLGLKLKSAIKPFNLHNPSPTDLKGIKNIDRSAIYNHSATAKSASDILGYTSIGLPIIFCLSNKTKGQRKDFLVMYSEVILLNVGVTGLIKHATKRPRPYVFGENVNKYSRESKTAQASFISGHTSLLSSNMFFLASTFSRFHPTSKLRPYIWGVAIAAPAVMGYLRVEAGVHYTTDVIAGYVLGAAIGLLIPALHKTKNMKEVTIYHTSDRLGLRWTF